jgi:integrase
MSCCTTWLASLVTKGRRRATITSYTNILKWHVRPDLGTRPLQSLTVRDFDTLYARLLADGRRRSDTGLSPTTVRYVAVIVAAALGDAFDKDLVIRNAAAKATVPAASEAPRLVVWTPEELRSFLDAVGDHRLATCFRLAGMTGLRRGELLALRWPAIDFTERRLTVSRQLVEVQGVVEEGPPKTKRSRRTVDLGGQTLDALRQLRDHHGQAFGLGHVRDGLVFCKPDGSHLRPGWVTAEFRRLVQGTDLPRISLHGLRHTHAAHLVASDTHVKAIAERLGHSSTSFSLDRYAHLLPTLGAEAATRIEALVDGSDR